MPFKKWQIPEGRGVLREYSKHKFFMVLAFYSLIWESYA
jgi:hypothetical protein